MDPLIDELIKLGYLKTPEIINAFRKMKREDFMLEDFKEEAPENYPLPIGFGQTISQPMTVAFMIEALKPQKGNKILDVGSGSGWTTSLLAEIVGKDGKVFGMEIIPELKDFGQENAEKYNFVKSGRTFFICGDGSKGLPEEAPFDRIHVAAASANIPEHLLEQLRIGGKMILPVGVESQELVLVEKTGEKMYKEQRFPGFLFVPLVTH
jgi:protein-L-isoaspartate(D-aspartate) O-methyltransferase